MRILQRALLDMFDCARHRLDLLIVHSHLIVRVIRYVGYALYRVCLEGYLRHNQPHVNPLDEFITTIQDNIGKFILMIFWSRQRSKVLQ